MTDRVNKEQRRPIWLALSAFYLDTELQDSDFKHIALTILDSPYSFGKVKSINKYEVFPILQSNLLSPAGAWEGFDETWLFQKITSRLEKKTKLNLIFQTFFNQITLLATNNRGMNKLFLVTKTKTSPYPDK